MKTLLRVLQHAFLIWFCLATSSAHADHSASVQGQVITKIVKSSSGKITIEVRYTVTDTIFVNSTPASKNSGKGQRVVLLPDGAPDWKQRQYLPGETFTVTYKFSFDKKDLPLVPFEVETSLPYNVVRIVKGPNKETQQADSLLCKAFAMVYFRGDKTVEISNPQEFQRLDRAWFTSSTDLPFTAVDPSLIPQSDLYPLDTLKEDWEDDYQLHFVAGLPYMVATKAVHPDTIAKYNNDDLPFGVVVDSTFQDANPAGATLGRVFAGVIRGRLVTNYTNDIGADVTLPLAGVFFKLKDQDKIYNEEFASGHTDENGNFTIVYSRGQSFAEGSDLELFIKFKSKNIRFDIKIKDHEVLGGTFESVHWIGHNIGRNVDMNLGEIVLDNTSYRPVHWAFRCWSHAVAEGVPMFPGLNILTNRSSSKFVPIFPGVTPPGLRPTIRLEEEDTRNENTIYHEFGHFLMWQAQGRNYIIAPGIRGTGHAWWEENTTRLAWSEGWAAGYQFILDAALRDDDQEHGYIERTDEPVMEAREIEPIRNGLQSEYYMACAIYDLWDGGDKGLPVTYPGPAGTRLHGFNDFITLTGASTWTAPEDISYSFRQIVTPLINHSGLSGKISNISEYNNYFLDEVVGSSCTERERVARVFNENRVVFDIPAFARERGYGSMSSDDLGVKVSRTTAVLVVNEEVDLGVTEFDFLVPYIYDDEYFLSNYRAPGVTENAIDFRFYSSSNMNISDFDIFGSLDATTGTTLTTTDVNLNTSASPEASANEKNGTLAMCSRSGIVMRSGSITLGGPSDYSASVELGEQSVIMIERAGRLMINNGSSIIVKSGGTLILRAGATLNALGNAKIIIESGGFICIDSDAIINLQDVQSHIILKPGAQADINRDLGLLGTCANPCGMAYSGLGAILNESETALAVTGPSQVAPQSQMKFSVPQLPGLSYTWSVTDDASIASGGNTNEVTILAGREDFVLSVSAFNPSGCELQTGSVAIRIGLANAVEFDGDNDFITLNDRADLNLGQGDFTFEIKFQSDFFLNSFEPQILLSNRSFADGSVADGFIIGILSTGQPFMQLAGAPNHFAASQVMYGMCHHLAVSRAGAVIKMFVDGNLVLTTTSNRSISSATDLAIGRDNPVRSSFNGEIGEVRIWNGALTDQAIASNIETGYIGTETNLIGLWNMNTKEDGIITDLASNRTAFLGTATLADNSEPRWTLNTTCGFSMFRGADNPGISSSRNKELIVNAKPMKDSLDNKVASGVKSFPNPTSAQETTLYVKTKDKEDLTLEIIDSFGNIIYASSGHKTNETLKIATPSKPGIYFVRARSKTGIYESKIVKL